jgi:general secretion pathway protein C
MDSGRGVKALNDNRRMSSRLLSFVIWLAVAASAAFWGLRLTARPGALPAHASVATLSLPQGGDLTRLFGAPPAPVVTEAAAVPADSRFKLLGVVAPAKGQHAGLALIAVDGKTPRAVAVGGRVDGELLLRSISHRRVELGASDAASPSVVLELPPLAEAARGLLPAAQGEGVTQPAPVFVPTPRAPAIQPPMLQRRATPPAAPPSAAQAALPFGVTPPGQAPAFGVTPPAQQQQQQQQQQPQSGMQPSTR